MLRVDRGVGLLLVLGLLHRDLVHLIPNQGAVGLIHGIPKDFSKEIYDLSTALFREVWIEPISSLTICRNR